MTQKNHLLIILILSIILLVIFLQSKIRENFDWTMLGTAYIGPTPIPTGINNSFVDTLNMTNSRINNLNIGSSITMNDNPIYIRNDTYHAIKFDNAVNGPFIYGWTGGALGVQGSKKICWNSTGLGIGTTSPGYPLHVTGSVGVDYGGVGGRDLNSGGIGNGAYSGGTTVTVCVEGTIWVNSGGCVRVTSDRRQKQNIHTLSDDFCKNFIHKVDTVSFSYKKNPNKIEYGYIAQDLIKAGFPEFVDMMSDEGLEQTVDDDGFVSPKNFSYAISKDDVVPILHKNIKILYEENTQLREGYNHLKEENEQLKNQMDLISKKLENLEKLFSLK